MLLLDASQFDFHWQNLHLKPMAAPDLQLYIDLYTNPRTMQFIHAPITKEKAIDAYRRVLMLNNTPMSDRLYLSITPVFSENAIGIVCINQLDRTTLTAELGCMLLRNGHGRGVGKHAMFGLMHRIVEKLAITQFEIRVQPGNLAALRSARLLGFTPSRIAADLYQLDYTAGQSQNAKAV